MVLTVYHLGLSQSDRAIWICEELNIDYELKKFDRDPVSRMAPEAYKQLSPTKTAPVITDTHLGKDVTIAETGAILEYINTVYGKGKLSVNPEDPDYAEYLFWLHFANASIMAMFMAKMLLARQTGGDKSDFIEERLTTYLNLLEERLQHSPYVGGAKFTIADMLVFWPVSVGRAFVSLDISPYPKIRDYVQRIASRPAYQATLEKGDPGFKLPLN